jgi:hypothetical protein
MMWRNKQLSALPRCDQFAARNGPPDGALIDAAAGSGVVRR